MGANFDSLYHFPEAREKLADDFLAGKITDDKYWERLKELEMEADDFNRRQAVRDKLSLLLTRKNGEKLV